MSAATDKRILFVDDEPKVLRALKRGLRRQASDWDMVFASGADEALAAMDKAAFDIVISDVTMPRTDGIELLRTIRDRHPDTVRVLMSGTAQGEVLMRAVPVAHRFLSKPWDVASLLVELQRAFELRAFMTNGAIRTVVGSMRSLPVLPKVYTDLCAALENPASRLDDIVAVVERDPAVVARLLHIVNSAFFAPPRPLHSTSDTIRYLGTSLLKSLLLTAEIFSRFDEKTLPKSFSLDAFQTHSLLAAKIASKLASPENRDRAQSAALLHGIGKLIFAECMPKRWGDAHAEAAKSGRALSDIEYEQFECTHAEVGGYLLGIWGLPQDLVEAVANHCDPMRSCDSELNLVAITHLASVLAAQELGTASENFDDELLQSLDGAQSLDAWRNMTASIAQAG